MLKRYAFSFYEVVVSIENLRNRARLWASSSGSYGSRSKVSASEQKEMVAALTKMRTECDDLGLIHTVDMISFIESEANRKGDDYTYVDMLNDLNTVNASFAKELRRNSFFRIANEKGEFFQKDELFGSKVNEAFKSCVGEIQSAGTCYALEQNEACVFHLMRILERGLGALASKFAVPFQHDNWHNIIEQLEAKIRKIDPTFGPDWKDQQKFYSRAASQFMLFKDAWRNHVMHVADVFDEGKALSVFNSVRVFMQALTDGGLTE